VRQSDPELPTRFPEDRRVSRRRVPSTAGLQRTISAQRFVPDLNTCPVLIQPPTTVIMVDANHSKGPGGSDSGVRKFTLSCSRCRTSKLKCDRKEPCVCCHFLHAMHLVKAGGLYSLYRWNASSVTLAIFAPKMSVNRELNGPKPSTETRSPPRSECSLPLLHP
jgi:hypothetical protein